MIEPDLGGIHLVPVASLVGFEQEIDAGTGRPSVITGDPGLAIMSAFGMGREVQAGDDLVSCHGARIGAGMVARYGILA